MRGRGIRVLLGVALLALALPWPAEGAFPGRNGKLAFPFYSLPQLNVDIWTVDPDGQNYTRLTTAPEADREPAWSANGRWIAFERAGNIWVMRADGTDARLVADLASPATSPAWSPDGRRIVFAAGIEPPEAFDPDFDLYVVNVDGTGLTKLVSEPNRSELNPSWSPDGTRIAFAGDIFGRCPSGSCGDVSLGLHTIAADGTGERLVTPGRFRTCISQPDWSPDVAKIAFTDCGRIYTVNIDGGALVGYPTDDLIRRVDPAWSPDGTRIAFASGLLGHMSAVDGSSLAVLGNGFDVTWQPLGPRREDFQSGSAFCRAEREFLGEDEFAAEYRNFGHCVSRA
jgi:Tol biopolymer transport system component